jgi:hypothetical protein
VCVLCSQQAHAALAARSFERDRDLAAALARASEREAEAASLRADARDKDAAIARLHADNARVVKELSDRQRDAEVCVVLAWST